MRARHVIETQQWQLTALSDELSADELLALGLSAAHLGDLDLAERTAARINSLSSDSPGNTGLKIIYAEVTALLKAKQAEELLLEGLTTDGLPTQQEALELLAEAIALKEAGRLPNGAATPLKPIHELAGEINLASVSPVMQLPCSKRLFNACPTVLVFTGCGRAHAATGNSDRANEFYEKLLTIRRDEAHPCAGSPAVCCHQLDESSKGTS